MSQRRVPLEDVRRVVSDCQAHAQSEHYPRVGIEADEKFETLDEEYDERSRQNPEHWIRWRSRCWLWSGIRLVSEGHRVGAPLALLGWAMLICALNALLGIGTTTMSHLALNLDFRQLRALRRLEVISTF